MSDENKDQDGQKETPNEAETKTAEQLEAERLEKEIADRHEKLKSLSDEEKLKEILALRNEAKERRLKEKELSDKLAEFEKKQAEEVEKDKKAKGKHEEIIADLKKELESLKPLAEKYTEYNKVKKAAIKKSLEEKEVWMDSFNKLELTELEALAEKFNSTATPKTDTSKNFAPSGNGKDERTAEEKMADSIYK